MNDFVQNHFLVGKLKLKSNDIFWQIRLFSGREEMGTNLLQRRQKKPLNVFVERVPGQWLQVIPRRLLQHGLEEIMTMNGGDDLQEIWVRGVKLLKSLEKNDSGRR